MPLIIIVFLIIGTVMLTGGIILKAIYDEEWHAAPIIIGAVALVLGLGLCAHLEVRARKMEQFNRYFGTDFTSEEAFWAGAEISELYLGDHRTVDLGDIEVTIEHKEQ